MKSIADSDYSLLTDKLPLVMQYAGRSIPATDTRARNALRMLAILQRKLERQRPTNPENNLIKTKNDNGKLD